MNKRLACPALPFPATTTTTALHTSFLCLALLNSVSPVHSTHSFLSPPSPYFLARPFSPSDLCPFLSSVIFSIPSLLSRPFHPFSTPIYYKNRVKYGAGWMEGWG
ncbi:hypothetical protein Pcinc_024408 [Petrolisthes cinctipes]|uniref:Uncharacterized protein n=1 Tax=Petrolisthes cinctipes TaxID=88211 RepID=A0AAE1FAZ6_PETCI|nr:hypothetical protein Pcinc_024408 [Petrolisthes cinctipes]